MKDFLDELEASLGRGSVLRPDEDLGFYEQGWRYGAGKAAGIVRPKSTREVALVLRSAADKRVRVQPMGANTGLVGASNPDETGDQLVLSFERLRSTIEVDPEDASVLVDAGVTLSALEAALEPYGLTFPIDLGADPQIGGMIATNTGGSRLLRYGDVRKNLLGLEVALADGTVIDALTSLRKNNTGLDWKQLFVGTSGVFGVITRARLALSPRPKQRTAVFVGCADGQAAIELLRAVEAGAGDFLSAFEVISAEALAPTFRHGAGISDPFADGLPPLAALVELSTSVASERMDLDELIEDIFGAFFEDGGEDRLTEVLVGPASDWWEIRHQVSESLRHEGALLALDLSVPRSQLPAFRKETAALVAERAPFVRVCDYGHWGDGGIHLNLLWAPEQAPQGDAWRRELQAAVYDLCVAGFGGSYSAEHGLGPHNQADYDRFTPARVRAICGALKGSLDPHRSLGTLRLD